MKKKIFLISAILLLILAGFCIRYINLGVPGFGTDEPLHVYAAKGLLNVGEPELPKGLFYHRAELFSRIVAQSFKYLGESEFSARFPSIIFGTITIAIIYFMGSNLFGPTVGLLSALFLAFAPFEVAWSRECRMYALFQMCFIFGAYAFFRGLEPSRDFIDEKVANQRKRPSFWVLSKLKDFDLKWFLIAFVFLLISIKLQALALTFVISAGAYLAVMSLSSLAQNDIKSILRSKYTLLLLSSITAGLFAIIMIPGLAAKADKFISFSPAWAQAYKFNPLYYIHFLCSTEVFPFGLLFFIGSVQLLLRRNKAGIYLFICIATHIIILTFIPTKVRSSRYIHNIFPFIILISAYSLHNILTYEYSTFVDRLKDKNRVWIRNISALVLLSFFTLIAVPWIYYDYFLTYHCYEDRAQIAMVHKNWRAATDFIKTHRQDGDIFITTEPLTAAFYGMAQTDYYISAYYTIDDPLNLGISEGIFAPGRLGEIMEANPRGWLLIDSGRFRTSFRTSPELSNFILSHCDHHIVSADDTMLVFSWGV